MSEYKTYINELNALTDQIALKNPPAVIGICGEPLYLIDRTLSHITQTFVKSLGVEVISLESEFCDEARFQEIFTQKSMFGEEVLYVLKNIDKKSPFLRFLHKNAPLLKGHLFLFSLKEKTFPTEVVSSNSVKILNCFPPQREDLVLFVRSVSAKFGISLSPDLARMMANLFGERLWIIENILRVARDAGYKHLTISDILAFSDSISDERVFELFRYLRSGNLSKSQLFIKNLLNNGESALAILGIVAKFLRDRTQTGQNDNSQTPSPSNAITAVADADCTLKSSNFDDFLVLSNVFSAFDNVIESSQRSFG